MPLTDKGEKIMSSMKGTYPSDKKAKEVFYASKNAGKISGVDEGDMGVDAGEVQHAFDETVDKTHKLAARVSAIEAHDDRSAEEHAKAAEFHEEEAERGDDCAT
jgi:hypothetical protein